MKTSLICLAILCFANISWAKKPSKIKIAAPVNGSQINKTINSEGVCSPGELEIHGGIDSPAPLNCNSQNSFSLPITHTNPSVDKRLTAQQTLKNKNLLKHQVTNAYNSASDPVNFPHTSNAEKDQTLEQQDSHGSDQVTLNGNLFSHPDNNPTTYQCNSNHALIANRANAQIPRPVGQPIIELTITDEDGRVRKDQVTVKTKNDPEESNDNSAGEDPNPSPDPVTPNFRVKNHLYKSCFRNMSDSPNTSCVSQSRTLYLGQNKHVSNETDQMGSINHPYTNVISAIKNLKAGDTLKVYAGTYSFSKEEKVILSLRGTDCAQIHIVAHGDGQVIFTDSIPEFSVTNSNLWESTGSYKYIKYNTEYNLDLSTSNVYKSKHPVTNYLGNSLIKNNIFAHVYEHNKPTSLVPYHNMRDFASLNSVFIKGDTSEPTRYSVPLYVGPGIFFDYEACQKKLSGDTDVDPSSCYLFVRLSTTPTQKAMGLQFPSENPNKLNIRIYPSRLLYWNRMENIVLEKINFESFSQLKFAGYGNGPGGVTNFQWKNSRIIGNSLSFSPAMEYVLNNHGSSRTCNSHNECTTNSGFCYKKFIANETGQCRRTQPVKNIRLSNLSFDHAFPKYVFYGDAKHGGSIGSGLARLGSGNTRSGNQGPAALLTSNMIVINRFNISQFEYEEYTPAPSCISIESSQIDNAWVAGYAVKGSNIFFVNNTAVGSRDDTFNYKANHTWNVDISHNKVLNSFSAFTQIPASIIPRDGHRGKIYVHHNIVDLERETSGRQGYAREGNVDFNDPYYDADKKGIFKINSIIGAFHGSGIVTPIQLYHNTFITKGLSTRAVNVLSNVETGAMAHALNNIFIQKHPDGYIRGGGQYGYATPGSFVDGNVYWRPDGTKEFVCNAKKLSQCCISSQLGSASSRTAFISLRYTNLDDQSQKRVYYDRDRNPMELRDRWHSFAFKSFRDFKCQSFDKVYSRYFDDPARGFTMSPLDLTQSSLSWHKLACKDSSCADGLDGNSHFYDPLLDPVSYQPGRKYPVNVKVPEIFPEANSIHAGAL